VGNRFSAQAFDHIEVLLRIGTCSRPVAFISLLDTRRAALEEAVHARTSEFMT
jgi:hypothetical protein